MKILKLAVKSLLHRRFIVSLTVFCIAVAVMLLLSLEKIKNSSEEAFTQTVSQVDLLVGARGGQLQLLLYSVFNMGQATNNVSWASYQHWKNHPAVAWTIPYSLGDSYRGFRVVATDENFFEHYRFRGDQKIELQSGQKFQNPQEVVLGSEAARELKVKIGDEAEITHGVTKGVGILHHDEHPFTVVGILKRTNTALDQSVYVSLESMELIHHTETHHDTAVSSITSFFVRTKSRVETLKLQREINEYVAEPLMAVIPGVALSELWRNLSYFETSLQVMIVLVAIFSLLILMLMMISTLENRRREMAILRSLGATPDLILRLLILESFVISILGVTLGYILTQMSLFVLRDFLVDIIGLKLETGALHINEILFMIMIIIGSVIISFVPGLKARRQALKDGLLLK